MCPIGASEFKRKHDTLVTASEGGGAPAQRQAVAVCTIVGAIALHLKNQGHEDINWELYARGATVVIAPGGENIAALQVGASDRFQGLLANREIVPGTFGAVDAGGATQAVVDDGVPNADGIGQIVDALVAATVVGTINYETGAIDFTWMAAFVGAGVTAGYSHRAWQAFGTRILGTVVRGGGEADIVLRNAAGVAPADNYADGINGQTYLGLAASSAGVGSMFEIDLEHGGPDTDQKLIVAPRFRNANTPLPTTW